MPTSDDQRPAGAAPPLAQLALQRLPAESSAAAILGADGAVLDALWARLLPLVGDAGVAAIFRRAVQTAARAQPRVKRVRVGRRGAEIQPLLTSPAPDSPALVATLGALVGALETILRGLVGPEQLAQLARDIERALEPPDGHSPLASCPPEGRDVSRTVDREPDDDR